jgi:hypothetical protein
MPTKKTVHWHPSVIDNEANVESNPVVNREATSYKDQPLSSFENPVVNRPDLFPKDKQGSSLDNPVPNKADLMPKGQPDSLFDNPAVNRSARYPQDKPGSSLNKPVIDRVTLSYNSELNGLSPHPDVNISAPRQKANCLPSKANVPLRRPGKSSWLRTQKSKRSVPPRVPDAPVLLLPPSTPRPSRLPTPDLPPVDPWAYYPKPLKSYNVGIIPPSPAAMRQNIARELSDGHAIIVAKRSSYERDATHSKRQRARKAAGLNGRLLRYNNNDGLEYWVV